MITALPAALVVGVLVRLVQVSERGLDFSDEGMYLLSADNGTTTAAFHNAFGRYTGVLFAAVGHDVERFRIAGVVLLVLASALLGQRVAACAGRLRGRSTSWWEQVGAMTVSVAGGVHYYSLMLLTPSYNWLNLVGICLAVGALLELVGSPAGLGRAWSWPWASVFVVGVAISTMGKISTGVFLIVALLAVPMATSAGRWRERIAPAWRTLPALIVVVALHWSMVNPPWVTAAQIRRGSTLLAALDPAHYSLAAALREIGEALLTIVQGFGLVAAPATLLIMVTSRWIGGDVQRERWWPVAAAFSAMLAGTGAALVEAWTGGREGYDGVGWVWVAMLASGAAILAGMLRSTQTRVESFGPLVVASLVCLLGGVSYAFGSGNGFFAQSGGAVVLFVAPALLVVLTMPRVSDSPSATLPLCSIAAVLAVGAAVLVDNSIERPYRQPDLAEAETSLSVGPRGGEILVDARSARLVDEVRRDAAAAGWVPGTPMLDFTHYSATLLYLLGAKPPPTLLVSVGGYPHVDDLARLSLHEADRADRRTWAGSWLLTSPIDRPGFAPDPSLVALVGRSFPSEYQRVGSFSGPSGPIILWRPRS